MIKISRSPRTRQQQVVTYKNSQKKIQDYLGESARRPKNFVHPSESNHSYKSPTGNKRISSLQNLGVIVEQVLHHTSNYPNSSLEISGYDGALGQNRDSRETDGTLLQKINTPPDSKGTVTASNHHIRFHNDGQTNLMFSATKQLLFTEGTSGSKRKNVANKSSRKDQQPLSSARTGGRKDGSQNTDSSPENLMTTQQIKVKISNEASIFDHNKEVDDQGETLDQKRPRGDNKMLKRSSLMMDCQRDSEAHELSFSERQDYLGQTTLTRHVNNITPSTVYNPSSTYRPTAQIANTTSTESAFNASIYNNQQQKPTLTPINLNERNMPQQASQLMTRNVVGQQPKQIQSMMVNMLKQQVQKRRKFEKAHNKDNNNQSPSQKSSTHRGDVHPPHSRDQSTSPIQVRSSPSPSPSPKMREMSVQTPDAIDHDNPNDDDEGSVYRQKIVFNMLSARSPAKQIFVTTKQMQDGSLPLIGLIPSKYDSSTARQPRTTRNNNAANQTTNSTMPQQQRQSSMLLINRQRWAQICQSAEMNSMCGNAASNDHKVGPPEGIAAAVKQHVSTKMVNHGVTKSRQNRQVKSQTKPLHELLKEPVSIAEQDTLFRRSTHYQHPQQHQLSQHTQQQQVNLSNQRESQESVPTANKINLNLSHLTQSQPQQPTTTHDQHSPHKSRKMVKTERNSTQKLDELAYQSASSNGILAMDTVSSVYKQTSQDYYAKRRNNHANIKTTSSPRSSVANGGAIVLAPQYEQGDPVQIGTDIPSSQEPSLNAPLSNTHYKQSAQISYLQRKQQLQSNRSPTNKPPQQTTSHVTRNHQLTQQSSSKNNRNRRHLSITENTTDSKAGDHRSFKIEDNIEDDQNTLEDQSKQNEMSTGNQNDINFINDAAANVVSISLNDYQWKRSGVDPSTFQRGSIDEYQDGEKLPEITTTQQALAEMSTEVKRKGAAKNRTVYNTQSEPFYKKDLKADASPAPSNRAVVALKYQSRDSGASSNLYQDIINGDRLLPPLIIDEQQPSFFDHDNRQSSQALILGQRQEHHQSHQSAAFLSNEAGQLDSQSRQQHYDSTGIIDTARSSSLGAGNNRRPSECAAISGKLSQFILRQRLRQRHMKALKYQQNILSGQTAIISHSANNIQVPQHQTDQHQQKKIPLTSLELYLREKQFSDENEQQSTQLGNNDANQDAVVTKPMISMDNINTLTDDTPKFILSPQTTSIQHPLPNNDLSINSSIQQRNPHHTIFSAQNLQEIRILDDPDLPGSSILLVTAGSHISSPSMNKVPKLSSISESVTGLDTNKQVVQQPNNPMQTFAPETERSIASSNHYNVNNQTTSRSILQHSQQAQAIQAPLSETLSDNNNNNKDSATKDNVKAINIDAIEESMVFALAREHNETLSLLKNNTNPHHLTSRNKKKSRWERFTFSNLDKLAPQNSYKLPFNPKLLEPAISKQLMMQQQRRQSPTATNEHLFPSKSPIMQLLESSKKKEAGVTMAEELQRYQYEINRLAAEQRSTSVPSRPQISTPQSFFSQNSVSTHLLNDKHQNFKLVSSSSGKNKNSRNQVNQSSQVNSNSKNETKTRIYLSKHADKSQRENLNINYQDSSKVQGWSPIHSMNSESLVITPGHHLGKDVTLSSRDEIQSPGIWPTTILKPMNQFSPEGGKKQLAQTSTAAGVSCNKQIQLDQTGGTNNNSEFAPDEEYETQYLSQVTKREFFNAANQNTNIQGNNNGLTSPEIELNLGGRNRPTRDTNLDEEDVNDRDNIEIASESQKQWNNKSKNDRTLHRRLQDIAYKIKNKKSRHAGQNLSPSMSIIDDISIKTHKRNSSHLQILRSSPNAFKNGALINGLNHNKKLQVQLLKQVTGRNNHQQHQQSSRNSRYNNDIDVFTLTKTQQLHAPRTSSLQANNGHKQYSPSNKQKEFRSIKIQNWDASVLPYEQKLAAQQQQQHKNQLAIVVNNSHQQQQQHQVIQL